MALIAQQLRVTLRRLLPGYDLRVQRLRSIGTRFACCDPRSQNLQIHDLPTRNAVESAHAQVVGLRELAHYYAGLASGVSIVELGRR